MISASIPAFASLSFVNDRLEVIQMYPEEKYVFTFEDKRQRNLITLSAEYIYFGGGEEDREELEMYKFLSKFADEFGWNDYDNN